MMQYPNKKKVNIKTFLETDKEKLDKEINEFRENFETIAINTNFAFDNKNQIYYHYVVFYYKKE